jgi:hypothetical protein
LAENNVLSRGFVPNDIAPDGREAFIRAMSNIGQINKRWPKYNAINCWHMNEYESAARWRLYLKSDEGIALQSTYAKLRDSIVDETEVFLGVVKYIDHDKEYIDAGNLLSPFVCKRKSFEHEREIRALITKWPSGTNGIDFSQETITNGLNVKVDLDRLVERIYVAPSAPTWFADLVKAAIQKYGYNFEVAHSNLNEQPVF